MEITNTPNIYTNYQNQRLNKKSAEISNTKNPIQKEFKPFAYQDFNISFSGRTPENFYEQGFNQDNMPYSMKNYLNYDYEQRQHIPPEQMMQEVFKYLENTKNFNQVKELYPNEDLFNNLHPVNKKSRTGILSEIKIARDLSDTPLLKDGSDDFGMYLLKKIYIQGKTLKEISKDFLEKDINDEYKGFISKPVDYSTISAYGIKFPKIGFWHSFIATRDEYKKFFITLPKNIVDPNREEVNSQKGNHPKNIENENDIIPKKHERKYKIKRYLKDQLQKDIKESDGNQQAIEKKVIKRFTKNDPEASFIVKYMSPIMTVAADRVHLSEEQKLFHEYEIDHGNKGTEKFMFSRFWKANPDILEAYAKSITDTIDMFEDIYGAGGLIPIDNEFHPIMPDSKNQKAIDYTTPEFIELLDYTKTIEPKRNEKYALHDKNQKEWEEYFENKDKISGLSEPQAPQISTPEVSPEELLKKTAEQFNAQVITLNGVNGQDVYITGNLDEVFKNNLMDLTKIYPSKYAYKYINKLTNNPEITDRYKLSLATRNIKNLINDKQIMSDEEFDDERRTIDELFSMENLESSMVSAGAMSEILLKYCSDCPLNIYKLRAEDFQRFFEEVNIEEGIPKILLSHKNELDKLYDKYMQKMTDSEKNKIALMLADGITKYEGKKGIADPDTREFLLMIKESITDLKVKRNAFKEEMKIIVPLYKYSRSILDKDKSPEQKEAIFELSMNNLIEEICKTPKFLAPFMTHVLSKEVIDKHKMNLSDDLQTKISLTEEFMPPKEKMIYTYPLDKLRNINN